MSPIQQEIFDKISNFSFTERAKAEEPYKFVREFDHHMSRYQKIFDYLCLPKNSSVFEMGPGCCYFLYLCRNHGYHVDAIDILNFQEVYQGARTALGMEKVVKHQRLAPFEKVKFLRKYDLIICTLPPWFRHQPWTQTAHMDFLEQVHDHLKRKGRFFCNSSFLMLNI